MDKETQLALNDILDALDGIVRNLRETNPGLRYGDIEFYLDRVSQQMEKISGMRPEATITVPR